MLRISRPLLGANLKVYKDKVTLYSKLLKIVGTVKTVTLAKFMKAQERIPLRDHSVRVAKKAFSIAPWGENTPEPGERTVAVAVTTNRGQCGALNSRIVKHFADLSADGGLFEIVVLGKKGMDAMPHVVASHVARGVQFDGSPSFSLSSLVYDHVGHLEYDRLRILYTRFVSAGRQEFSEVAIPSFAKWKAAVEEQTTAPDVEDPTQDKLSSGRFFGAVAAMGEEGMRDFYDFQVATLLTHAQEENSLSELASRMAAVENQLSNLVKLRDWARSVYNKTRQANITAEMLELVNAKSAVDSMMAAEAKKAAEAAEAAAGGGDVAGGAAVRAVLEALRGDVARAASQVAVCDGLLKSFEKGGRRAGDGDKPFSFPAASSAPAKSAPVAEKLAFARARRVEAMGATPFTKAAHPAVATVRDAVTAARSEAQRRHAAAAKALHEADAEVASWRGAGAAAAARAEKFVAAHRALELAGEPAWVRHLPTAAPKAAKPRAAASASA